MRDTRCSALAQNQASSARTSCSHVRSLLALVSLAVRSARDFASHPLPAVVARHFRAAHVRRALRAALRSTQHSGGCRASHRHRRRHARAEQIRASHLASRYGRFDEGPSSHPRRYAPPNRHAHPILHAGPVAAAASHPRANHRGAIGQERAEAHRQDSGQVGSVAVNV